MKKYLKFFVTFLLSIITIISLNLNLNMNIDLTSMKGNNIVYMILFVILCYVFNKVLQIKEKRLVICATIISFLLAMFKVVGDSINASMALDYIISSKIAFLQSFIKLIGMFNIIYIAIIIIYTKLIPYISNIEKKKIKLFNTNKKNFFIIWAIIFIAWLPYLLRYFPGIITPDSMDQIYQTQGINTLTNHHPVFHTLFIAIAINIGKLFNNYNIGVAIYSICQRLALSGIFAYSIYYMSKKNISNIIKVISFIFYAFYPVFGMYSITMWKDIPFAIVMLLFIIQIVELVSSKEEFWNSKKKIIMFIVNMLLVIMFRNNGIYVVILTIPFLAWFNRKYWKKVLIVSIVPILFYILYTGPVFSILNIQKGSVREALSIPLQQFAKIEKDRGAELSNEQLQTIHRFLPVDDLPAIYNPVLSDTVKSELDEEYFNENKGEFISIWIELVFSYPVEAIESFLCNNYGYWYPEAQNWVVSRAIPDNELNIHINAVLENKIIDMVDGLIDKRDIPVISMIFSIGFMFWIIIICMMYIIYKKEYVKILIFIPILALWLTTIASPVFCEYRYVFSMVVSLPLIVSTIGLKIKE